MSKSFLIIMPLMILAGVFLLDDRKYFFVSLAIVIYTLLIFFMRFEFKKPPAREVVILSVMVAIAVVGRAAFFITPNFKPITAIVIIAGVALGAEAGFIVGAMSGFVSSFIFGLGPWTPWQMFALGLIGYLSGVVFRGREGHTVYLCAFGALCAFFIYGGIVDLWTILGFSQGPDLAFALSVYTMAVPFNLIHAVATVIFLALLAKPMIQKLQRVKLKFGLTL